MFFVDKNVITVHGRYDADRMCIDMTFSCITVHIRYLFCSMKLIRVSFSFHFCSSFSSFNNLHFRFTSYVPLFKVQKAIVDIFNTY